MNDLSKIYQEILSNEVAFLFSAIILVWLFFAAVLLISKTLSQRQICAKFISITPSSLTTLGVLGTFTGILIGLLDFDVSNVDASVPQLLKGLKIAFTTSIVGIVAAILFRLLRTIVPDTSAAEGATPENILAALFEIRDDGRALATETTSQHANLLNAISSEGDSSLLTQFQNLRSTVHYGQNELAKELSQIRDNGQDAATQSAGLLTDLRNAISSEGDSSLLTQFQKLRTNIQDGQNELAKELSQIRDNGQAAATQSAGLLTDLRNAISSEGDSSLLAQFQELRTTVQDGQNELIKEFRQYAEHMIENSQKGIIEALEQVIRDFNQNLTEQFGENFKQLNEAVHGLTSWQDKYKEHVEALEARLEMAVTAVETTQQALQSVQEHSEKIPEAIQYLEPALSGVNSQTQVLMAHLEAVAGLREKAIEAFPVVEANLEKITTQLSESVELTVQKSRQALTESEGAQAKLAEGYQGLLKDAAASQEGFSSELSNTLKQMNEKTALEFARHGDLIEAGAKEAEKVSQESWIRSTERINSQFEAFDKQMQQELTRSLELLGRNLAAISQKFVDDYTPLTDRLRDLVTVSGRIS